MTLFLLLIMILLCGCSQEFIYLKDPKLAQIKVTIQDESHTLDVLSLPNFSPLSSIRDQIDCVRYDCTKLNWNTILKDQDIIVLYVHAGLSISINQAQVEDLVFLPGIGEVLAERIISYRNTFGLFQKIEDIQKVKGIKSSLFNKIKQYLRL